MLRLGLFSCIVMTFVFSALNCSSGQEASKQGDQVTIEQKVQHFQPPKMENNPYDSLLTLDFILGKFDPTEHPQFSKIPAKYTDKEGIMMHTDALAAFEKMAAAAEDAGYKLVIRSAARNFKYQRSIWEAKWSGKRILSSGINAAEDISEPTLRAKEIMKYSAMPGASRHHWGTDIDLNAFDNAYFESGKGKLIYDWLIKNANQYGYYLVYTAKGDQRPTGYEEEKWHWTYKPISKYLTAFAREQLRDSTLTNFSGSEVAPQLNVVSNYVLGIAPNCH